MSPEEAVQALDPFAAAALRQRRAVKPEAGRQEGLTTKIVEAPGKIANHWMGSLATLPERSFANAANWAATGEYDPGVPLEAALLATGGRIPFAGKGELGVGGGKLGPAGEIPKAGGGTLKISDDVYNTAKNILDKGTFFGKPLTPENKDIFTNFVNIYEKQNAAKPKLSVAGEFLVNKYNKGEKILPEDFYYLNKYEPPEALPQAVKDEWAKLNAPALKKGEATPEIETWIKNFVEDKIANPVTPPKSVPVEVKSPNVSLGGNVKQPSGKDWSPYEADSSLWRTYTPNEIEYMVKSIEEHAPKRKIYASEDMITGTKGFPPRPIDPMPGPVEGRFQKYSEAQYNLPPDARIPVLEKMFEEQIAKGKRRGFMDPLLHGASKNLDKFVEHRFRTADRNEPGAFLTPDHPTAFAYGGAGPSYGGVMHPGFMHPFMIRPNKMIEFDWSTVSPFDYYNGPGMQEAFKKAKAERADAMKITNISDVGGTHPQIVTMDPSKMRSIIANFNDLGKDNFFASLVPGAVATPAAIEMAKALAGQQQ